MMIPQTQDILDTGLQFEGLQSIAIEADTPVQELADSYDMHSSVRNHTVKHSLRVRFACQL
jgi:hypothetical protein